MTTLAYTLSDSRVMLRRNLKHQLRYPSMTVMLIGIPIVLLLLFVYVFGGQLGAGLGAHEGRSAYLNYVVPGLLLLTVASAIIWLAVALGLAAKSVETASNTPMILFLLCSSAAASCPRPPCQRACASSLSTSRSPPSPTPCADCSAAPRLATTPSPPSPGASASLSWPTSGLSASTTGAERPSRSERGPHRRG